MISLNILMAPVGTDGDVYPYQWDGATLRIAGQAIALVVDGQWAKFGFGNSGLLYKVAAPGELTLELCSEAFLP